MKRLPYDICEYCGDHIDHGSICDCQKREARTAATARTSNDIKKISYHYDTTEKGGLSIANGGI